ncbi:MAG: TetR family transcriptional regulator, partial [Acutalibacteraceae bacterium]|nr:TetR family transcriptional regulator [Acutalibacteraceae bacterium]
MPERTRLTILHAFDRLVERVGFSKITVSMLVREAGVSRATFYRYFTDKYDVMNYNYKQMVDMAFTPERIDTLEDLFLIFYQMGRTYWQPLVRMFDSTGINSLSHFIADYSYEAAEKIIEANRKKPLTEVEKLKLRVFCGGCSYMYEDWIRGKYEMTPEEAAHALYM